MNFEPAKFFIGVIDLFSVLLPGTILTFLVMNEAGPLALKESYHQLNGTAGWIAFFIGSYLLGHFIFLTGSMLDGWLYDPIRQATDGQQIRRLADGKPLSWGMTRWLASGLFRKVSDAAQDQAITLKNRSVAPLGNPDAINAFQYCKARLVLEGQPGAAAAVQRLEADSKFFRSLFVMLVVVVGFEIAHRQWDALLWDALLIAVMLLPLALWRYVDQREKAINLAYWYVITLEAKAAQEKPADTNSRKVSHAGGVVYRLQTGGRAGDVEFLLVQAKHNASEYVLPKGHVEPNERMQDAAVREVMEESGTWATVEAPLDLIVFDVGGEHLVAQFYLMREAGWTRATEKRKPMWVGFGKADKLLKHPESKQVLAQANAILSRTSPASHQG